MSLALCLTRAVWFSGNVGGRDSARGAGLPELLKSNSSATVWAFDFLGMCFCVLQLVRRHVLVMPLCSFACTCLLCSGPDTECMYPILKYTNTHCLLFWYLGTNLSQLLLPVFYWENSVWLNYIILLFFPLSNTHLKVECVFKFQPHPHTFVLHL